MAARYRIVNLGQSRQSALNWVLFEQTSHESRVEIGADLNDFVSAEPGDPTVPVIKPETVLSAGEGAQFHYSPISADHPGLSDLGL
jgi:hypothetical protein